MCYEQAQWDTKTCSKSKGLLRWRNPTLLHSPVVSNFVFHHPLIIGCLNWIKRARMCHCPLNPSQVSSSPAGAFTSRLFLKTSCFGLGSLGLRPGAGTWDDNYTVLPLSGRVAEPSAHKITQNEGGGILEEGSVMRLWLDVLPCLRAKLFAGWRAAGNQP